MATRQVSAATRERLRAMRERYGLGEYAKGDPFKGRRGRRGARASAKASRKPRKMARRRPFAGGGGKSGGGGASGGWGFK